VAALVDRRDTSLPSVIDQVQPSIDSIRQLTETAYGIRPMLSPR
jgi:hypothetical protein